MNRLISSSVSVGGGVRGERWGWVLGGRGKYRLERHCRSQVDYDSFSGLDFWVALGSVVTTVSSLC